LVGISLMLLHEIRMADVRGLAWLGIGLTISSITTASVASVIQATQTAHRQPILPWLAWALGWGALFNLLAALLIDGAPVLPLDVRYLGGVAFLGLFGSALTFPFYLQLVRALGPGRAAYITVVIPIIAMLISTLLEGYRWS
jgi:drug/metabolite transporter (DMT)-like permease